MRTKVFPKIFFCIFQQSLGISKLNFGHIYANILCVHKACSIIKLSTLQFCHRVIFVCWKTYAQRPAPENRAQNCLRKSCPISLQKKCRFLFTRNEPLDYQLTGQLVDKPTRRQTSRGLDNSRTSQLADSEFKKETRNYYTLFVH